MVETRYKITIVGDGAMATLCAIMLHQKNCEVTLWSPFPEYAKELAQKRENTKYFPGFSIPSAIKITNDRESAFLNKPDIVISAIPTQFLRAVWNELKNAVPKEPLFVSVTKGIENQTLKRPSEILRELIGEIDIVVLSGPNIAIEIARGLPATSVAACENLTLAKQIQELFTSKTLRIYTNSDVVGVELAGALKNIIAIAAGIVDGLNLGTNTKAALLTRGLVEISRLGVICGAKRETFSGLAGLGDLITTCFSPHGRNRRFGELVGKGFSSEEAQKQIQSVVEGIKTAKSALDLARNYSVEMPITQAIYDIIYKGKKPTQAIAELMERKPKEEF